MIATTDTAATVRDWLALRRDIDIARSVRRLFHESGIKPAGWCSRYHKAVIMADAELDAFLKSVAMAGPDGWREEIDRVRLRQVKAARKRGGKPDGFGAPALSLAAIVGLLPTWRAWGRMLIDAGKVPAGR